MKHINTILLVNNIEVSKRFYSETLELKLRDDWKTMVVYEGDLALHQAGELQPKDLTARFTTTGPQGHGNVVIYLQSEDLDACFADLQQRGVEILHGIVTLPWERLFRVKDPDGYIIEIGEAR
jgi:predicted enzyme related to lactoylglutathione lyase